MSLTLKQQPISFDVYKLIHQDIYPIYYTCISDNYTESDFKYVFSLNTIDGVISTTKNSPYIKDGVGVYNSNMYLKNILFEEFNPKITDWTKKEGSIINYRVDVKEYSSNLSSPDEDKFEKALVIKSDKEDFKYNDYILNDINKSFLTNWESQRKIDLDNEYATIKFISGKIKANSSIISYTYQITVTVYRGDTKYYYRTQVNNPYYTASLSMSNDNDVLEDLSDRVLEYPISPRVLNTKNWYYSGYVDGTGYHSVGTYISSDILEIGDEYTVQTYNWPQGTNGRTSKELKLKVVSYCKNNIQLQWENELGGFDFYTFEKNMTLTDNIKTNTFRKTRDEIGIYDGEEKDYFYGHTEYDRGETTFHQDIETYYTLNTDWLTDAELIYFRELYNSKNIYAYIDGKFYPVIGISKKKEIKTDVRKLTQLKFDIRLSNKIYK